MKPCNDCPYKRDTGSLGGADVEVYLGQASGPFWLPCHQDKNYAGKESDATKVTQCRGAAKFRSNIGVEEKLPDALLKVPADKETVFGSNQEMYAHYKNIDIEETSGIPEGYWQYLVTKEMNDSRLRRVNML